jgi:PH (Pleckstrin Homology) domain-containing protein
VMAEASSLRRLIGPDERVVWSGAPDRRAYMFKGSWLAIPFSVMWAGFAVFWEASVIAAGGPPFFVLWGIPFVLMGAYITVGRFVVAGREAQRTEYLLTDRRVVIRTGAFSTRTTELPLATMASVELEEGRDGIGSITFGPSLPFRGFFGPGWPGAGRYGPAFQAVRDANRVYRLINDARSQLAPGAPTA